MGCEWGEEVAGCPRVQALHVSEAQPRWWCDDACIVGGIGHVSSVVPCQLRTDTYHTVGACTKRNVANVYVVKVYIYSHANLILFCLSKGY